MSEPSAPAPAIRQPAAPSMARRLWTAVAKRIGEIAIVTAGILLAFALDAWWDSRATAEHEQIHLRALASDMRQNVAALDTLVSMEERITENSQALLSIAARLPTEPTQAVRPLIEQVFNSSRYEPVLGAYEALINSGGLTLIRDEKLRAGLAEFAASVRGQYAEHWSDEHYFTFAREYGGRMLLNAQGTDALRSEGEFRRMLAEPRFVEHVAMRYYSERDMTRKYRALLGKAQALLEQLRAQVDAD
jgi:hypothetical protein